jgi:DNA modification methylase
MIRPATELSAKEQSKITKEEWREYTKTVWHIANTSHTEHPAVFPLEIPKRLIKLFSFCEETVMDPFAGTGVTARAALELGRKAVCVEQNARYAQIISDECGLLGDSANLSVIRGDSRDMSWCATDSIDLLVTSPPYWNKAEYGGSEENIGSVEGYQRFLVELSAVFSECGRVLRPNRKLCIVTANVNQYTDRGLLTFPLAADMVTILRDLGMLMVGEIIWSKDGTGGKWGSWGVQRPIFGSYPYPPNFLFKNVHEHILIFSKDSEKRIKNPKALPYEQLMDI